MIQNIKYLKGFDFRLKLLDRAYKSTSKTWRIEEKMYRLVFLLTCLVFCKGHAVLPVIAPVLHALPAPILSPYNHGYTGLGFGHGYLAKPLGHHILKRSPHIVPVNKYDHIEAGLVGTVGNLAGMPSVTSFRPLATIQQAAVSHQQRGPCVQRPQWLFYPVVVKEVHTPVGAPYI